MPITHPFVSAKSDGGDATLVRPSDWNADHVGGGFYLDNLPLHGTHGDEFEAASLDGIWTPRGVWDSDAVQFGVGGTWLQAALRTTSAASIFQTMPSKETFEIIAAMSQQSTTANIVGPAVVGSTGTGVAVGFRTDETLARLENLTSYAHASSGASLPVGNAYEHMRGTKVWWSLRRVLTGVDGDIYGARYSLDGFTWSKEFFYDPGSITPTQIGWGRFYNGASGDLMSLDRFNVVGDLDQGNNLVITPTSGTPTYSASSSFGGLGASRAADGGANDWAANTGNSDNPFYWEVAWSVGQSFNRVLVKERSGDTFGLAHVELFDGATTTKVPFRGFLGGSALWHMVDFPTLTGITTLRIVSDGGGGANGGFIEVEAYLRS